LVGRNKNAPERRMNARLLAGQITPNRKPPKFLMGKQIKHLVSS